MICAGLAGVLAGALYVFALSHYSLLAWLVAAPLIIPLYGGRPAGACVAGVMFGLVAAVGGNAPWVAQTAEMYFGIAAWQANAAALLMAIVWGAGFGCGLGLLLWTAASRSPLCCIFVAGAVWAAWESLLLAVVPYYPWVSLAATQVDHAPLLQVAGVFGQSVLSAAMAAAGTAWGLAASARHAWRTAMGCAAVGLILVGGVAAYGALRLPGERLPESSCSVAAVDASSSAPPSSAADAIRLYAAISQRAVAARPSVIVWPESALPGYLESDRELRQEVESLVSALGVPLIAGGPRLGWTAQWQPQLFNSVYYLKPGEPMRVYDKRHLVPFAEYWPHLLGKRPHWLPADEVAAGRTAAIFAAGDCRLGILVCFEVDRPSLARELTLNQGTALLVLSNDAQLSLRAVHNEVAQARLRAVETGLPLVRVANHGSSVIVDPYGRILGHGSGGAFLALLPLSIPAPAVHWGPIFMVACWVVVLAAAALALAGQFVVPGPHSLPKLSR